VAGGGWWWASGGLRGKSRVIVWGGREQSGGKCERGMIGEGGMGRGRDRGRERCVCEGGR